VNVDLLDGQLAWRQHDGGHTDAPNVKHFLRWADRHYGRAYTAALPTPLVGVAAPNAAAVQQPWPSDRPRARTDSNSMLAHRQLLAKRTQGKIDAYYIGDSITRRWGATDYPQLLENWKQNFFGWNAADFGWGADRIENILWRLDDGELDGVNPKVIVLLAGTNNLPGPGTEDAKVEDITRGLRALVDRFRAKAPNAAVILTGIFPRTGPPEMARAIVRINENLSRMADGRTIRYVNVNAKLGDAEGKPYEPLFVDGLHPSLAGYQIWADALKPILTELLGPPKATDEAPPPTGDPSARRP
jgi:lysophospholipase L1-like esterase